MSKYVFSAVTKDGKSQRGEMDATSRDEVVTELHKRGLVVIHVDQKVGLGIKEISQIQIGGVPLDDKVVFMRQFATMVSAGLPLTQALEVLAIQQKNPVFRSDLEQVLNLVEGGKPLSFAFGRQKGLFNEIQLNLLKAGEESGKLVDILNRIADDLEKSRDFQGKLKGAMIYPAVIFVAVIVVMVLMVTFMIPSMKELYASFGAEKLPFLTELLVSISDAFIRYWWAFLFLAIAGVGGFIYYRNTKSGRRVTDSILLKLPIFGNLHTKSELANFTRTLALLLKSGLPILDALNVVARSLSNVHFQEAIDFSRQQVSKGIPLAVPLAKDENIPIILSRMVAIGEETGKLDEVLEKVAYYYESEVDNMTSNLTKLMEPVILLVVGGVVGILAIAVYLPMYQIGNVMGI